MFCLRSWVPLLIFLTNASPIYVLLFLTATYALQRPCVYCSILLFVLVFSLFDFHADWFEPRWDAIQTTKSASESISSLISGNATLADAILESASLAVTAINGTGRSIASAAIEGARQRMGTGSMNGSIVTNGGFEWLRTCDDNMSKLGSSGLYFLSIIRFGNTSAQDYDFRPVSKYNEAGIINAIADIYQIMIRFGHLQPQHITFLPPQGHDLGLLQLSDEK
ncbi:Hypothetical protein R9X50_00695900 [Acrodontium crateriforme]|uniref:Uncharacterized protein n=1 Tax=Acrodontium crateriforme TaxID=150365 RepID=A0AAQ3M9U0_9PEZI|nr:Hypothetical protein R9X50_00695900 [Acrodontium crateriforme]